MFDRFDIWQYRDDANCWDYVREWLIEKAGVPAVDVPKFGICPYDKKSMHAAHNGVIKTFIRVDEPLNHAIAAQYIGKTIFHVGIVDGDNVRHTGRKQGTRKEKIKEFEKGASRVVYYLHKSLHNGHY